MIVCIPTIKHSGTHLFKSIFSDFRDAKSIDDIDGNCRFIFHTISENYHKFSKIMDMGVHIICPMRHPARILESHKRRKVYPCSIGGLGYEDQWETMIRIYEDYDPIFVHIDRPERDEHLMKASERINYPLETTWPLLGSHFNTHDFDVSGIDVPGWIMDFYNRI